MFVWPASELEHVVLLSTQPAGTSSDTPKPAPASTMTDSPDPPLGRLTTSGRSGSAAPLTVIGNGPVASGSGSVTFSTRIVPVSPPTSVHSNELLNVTVRSWVIATVDSV